jgi:KDO2-lipid IV(A) lauroyltransferase
VPAADPPSTAEAAHDRRPRPARARRLRYQLEYAGFLAVYAVLKTLPLRAAMAVAATAAGLLIRVSTRLRRIGLTNLHIAFPERTETERRAILIASFRNLGRMVAECAHMSRLTPANIRTVVHYEDERFWTDVMLKHAAETGILILTGHFGNWELFAQANGLLGHPVDLVHQTIKNPYIDAFVEHMRSRAGTRLLRKHGAARGVLRALAERRIMVLPLDQNASGRTGIFVDFFGRAASTNAGFGRVVARTGVPVFPAFLIRDGTSARHRIVFLPALSFASMADRDHATREVTQRCTAVLEDMIRRHPDHWLWTHKRWRTRPVGEADLYTKA